MPVFEFCKSLTVFISGIPGMRNQSRPVDGEIIDGAIALIDGRVERNFGE